MLIKLFNFCVLYVHKYLKKLKKILRISFYQVSSPLLYAQPKLLSPLGELMPLQIFSKYLKEEQVLIE